MSAPVFALVIGLVYIGAGILGFTGELPATNLLSALYLLVGAWGCGAWAGAMGAVRAGWAPTQAMAALTGCKPFRLQKATNLSATLNIHGSP